MIKEENIRKEALIEVAKKMLIAARTAPKGKGQDNMVLAMVEGEEIKKISDKLKEMAEKLNFAIFKRDAENILNSSVIVLFGTKIKSLGLPVCGLCGFKNCSEKSKYPNVPCVFNTGDLGIAMGSAASIAMDNRVDNRIMYTVGMAALELGILGEDVKIAYGIPLSVMSKNPFFDRT